MSSPFINPGSSPIQPTPNPTEGPKLGPDAAGQKPFNLPNKGEGAEKIGQAPKQTPMEASQDTPGSKRWSEEEMLGRMEATKQKMAESQMRLRGPEGKTLTNEHTSALAKLTEYADKDLRSIAEKTQNTYQPPAPKQKQSVVERLVDWLDGAQGAMGEAMAFKPKVGKDGNIDPTEFLKLQYSVQRASQRVEVFSNVIGSTVSGIKTLMSTQLG